jgi:hypothetical protein
MCPDADEKGIAVLHGAQGLFEQISPNNTYRGLYQVFKKVRIGPSNFTFFVYCELNCNSGRDEAS